MTGDTERDMAAEFREHLDDPDCMTAADARAAWRYDWDQPEP